MVFVNQTITFGKDPRTDTASSLRVTLDKIGGRWMTTAFEPVWTGFPRSRPRRVGGPRVPARRHRASWWQRS